MKVGLAGQGAFGIKHLEAIQAIPGIEVITLAGGRPAGTEEVAKKWKIPHWTTNLTDSLKQPGLEAMILASPTQVHAKQAIETMRAGKHVLIEIPIADTLADSEEIQHVAQQTGVIAMGGYNTFCEILSFDKRALIVPRTKPRLEQYIRAARAQELGLVRMSRLSVIPVPAEQWKRLLKMASKE